MTPEIPPPKPDPRLRMGFPLITTRGLPAEVIMAGIFVAMQETEHDGTIYHADRVATIEAGSVRVEVTKV